MAPAPTAGAGRRPLLGPPNLLARLFLLVALALLPAGALLISFEIDLRDARTQATRDQALRLARDASARLGRFVEGLREALVVLSEAQSVRSGDAEGCTAMLGQLRQRFPAQILLGAVDMDGWLRCSTLGTPPGRIHDGDRSFFQIPMATGQFVVSEWESGGSLLPGGTVHFGLPIRGVPGGPARGVVAAAVGTDWIADLLRPVGLPPGAELTVVDRLGQVVLQLSERPEGALTAGQPVPAALRAVLPPLPGDGADTDPEATGSVTDAPGPDGTPRFHGLAPFVPGSGGALRLVVSLDSGLSLGPVEAATHRALLLILCGMALALVAAWVGSRRFVLNPLAALLDAAAAWEAGRFSARAGPALSGSIPELARLAGALDRMAEAAAGRDRAAAALLENEARLTLALEAGELAAWELDRTTGAIVRSASHDLLFGYTQPAGRWTWRAFLQHVLPEDRPAVKAAFRANRGGEAAMTLEFRIRRLGDGDIRWLEARGAVHRPAGGGDKLLGVLADVTERRRAEARLRLTVGELNHRVKNTLASVQSIAAQTLRGPDGPDNPIPAAARAAFQARLLALARSHEVLTREGWTGADLSELVRLALAPHGAAQVPGPGPGPGLAAAPGGGIVGGIGGGIGAIRRFSAEGPPLRVPPRLAVPLAVALHELSTNAARHGALSLPEGSVAVRWRLLPPREGGQPPVLHLVWQERGGPEVRKPARRGFGTRLLEGGLGRELGGSVHLSFRPEGVVCELRAPLRPQVPAAGAAA